MATERLSIPNKEKNNEIKQNIDVNNIIHGKEHPIYVPEMSTLY